MGFNKDSAIVAQNAATAAATVMAALIAQRGDTAFNADEYEDIRTHIFQGSMALGGAEAIVEVFEGEGDYDARGSWDDKPSTQTTRYDTGKRNADFVIKAGKHRGKTLQQIDAADPGWLKWAAGNMNNDFAKRKIQEYLAA